jgi:hypothetical protein
VPGLAYEFAMLPPLSDLLCCLHALQYFLASIASEVNSHLYQQLDDFNDLVTCAFPGDVVKTALRLGANRFLARASKCATVANPSVTLAPVSGSAIARDGTNHEATSECIEAALRKAGATVGNHYSAVGSSRVPFLQQQIPSGAARNNDEPLDVHPAAILHPRTVIAVIPHESQQIDSPDSQLVPSSSHHITSVVYFGSQAAALKIGACRCI